MAGSPKSDDPFASLVNRLRLNEPCNDELYRLTQIVTGYIRHRHRCFYADADDIASDVIVAAYKGLDRYKGQVPFLNWVRGITDNVVRRRWERTKDKPKSASWEELGEQHGEGPPDDPLLVQSRWEDGQIFGWDFEEEVAKLGEPARTVVSMRLQEGRSSQEVAAAIGRTDANTRQILVRACAALRRALEARGWRRQHRS